MKRREMLKSVAAGAALAAAAGLATAQEGELVWWMDELSDGTKAVVLDYRVDGKVIHEAAMWVRSPEEVEPTMASLERSVRRLMQV